MKYHDLRDFVSQLEKTGELKRVAVDVDPHLEMTEICDRVLRAGGPAILFEKPKGHAIPVLANLFGTPQRVALGTRIVGAMGDAELTQRVVAIADEVGESFWHISRLSGERALCYRHAGPSGTALDNSIT